MMSMEDELEQFRAVLASIGDAVVSTDADGRVTFMNRAAEDLTGWSRDEAVGRLLPEVFHTHNEHTRQPAENPGFQALREGNGLEQETATLTAKDGTQRAIDQVAAPIRSEGGEPVGCVLVFRDVSGRRRLEQQTQERLAAARFLASIVESSEDAIVSKSLAGIIQSWNAGAERLFGYTAERAIGHHISLIIPADRAEEEEQVVTRLRAGERIEHLETVRLRSDGQRVHVSLTVSPILDETGQVIGASKIVRDITADKLQRADLPTDRVPARGGCRLWSKHPPRGPPRTSQQRGIRHSASWLWMTTEIAPRPCRCC